MEKLILAGREIAPGTSVQLQLPVARLYTDTNISIPIHVIRAKKDGPTLLVSAAIHGDEINGIEIIRRLISKKNFKLRRGTLIAVPIVNVYGVLNQSRYMPDRRDLNRCFPGSPKGSLAGRLANLFLTEIVSHCDYGIDLHTGAIHRSNLPQIRANLEDPETLQLAKEFAAPVILNANLRDGSLRFAALENKTKMLLYEAGEALRFDELSIRAGLNGVINVMRHLGLLQKVKHKPHPDPFTATRSAWVRATSSGIVNDRKKLGDHVENNELLAEISDPFGNIIDEVFSFKAGIIIGKQNIPLVQEGDAMYHVAYFEAPGEVADHIELVTDTLLPEDELEYLE